MPENRKIVSFDTSAINRLADDPDSDALIAGLTDRILRSIPFHGRFRNHRDVFGRPARATSTSVQATSGGGRLH